MSSSSAPSATSTGTTIKPDFDFNEVTMPALSSTMKEGKIVQWTVKEGDEVSSGDTLMVVESDKADMDVEAFDEGFVAAILTEEGETASVGAPVAYMCEDANNIAAMKAYAKSVKNGGSAAIVSDAPKPV